MPIDPGLVRVLERKEALGAPAMSAGTVEQARAALRFVTVGIRKPEHVVGVGDVEDLDVPGPRGPIPIRIHRPEQHEGRAVPTVAFVHGGGLVLGDLDTHDNQARRLCRDVDAVVVTMDYRLAPEHPFPAGFDDVLAVVRWVGDHLADLGGDPARLGIAGDSSGGHLAALATIACRDGGGPRIAAQLLLYPSVDLEDEGGDRHPSRLRHGEGLFLTADDMRWFGDHAIPADLDPTDPTVSPINADLAGLPPALVVTAEHDPLCDEGDAYAARLSAAGVAVDHWHLDEMIHGFFDMWLASEGAEAAVARITARFRELLA